MEAVNHPFEPDWTFSPGHMLRLAMENRGLAEADLHRAGLLPETAAGILGGTTAITGAFAARIEAATGVPASYWLASERIYRSDLARGARDWSGEDGGDG